MGQGQTLRVAVRKFAPFEEAIRRQFEDFVAHERLDLKLEAEPLDLNDLHPALFERGGLREGKYDVAFMVTDWLGAAVEEGLLADLTPLMRAAPLADFPQASSESLTRMPQVGGGLYGLPYHDGPEALIYRTDLIERPPATWDEFIATMQRVADPQRR